MLLSVRPAYGAGKAYQDFGEGRSQNTGRSGGKQLSERYREKSRIRAR